MSSSSSYQPVHIYPSTSDLSELMASGKYSSLKRFHVIRHAEGTHNVNKEYKNEINLDARLTERGKEQCRALAQRLLLEDTTSILETIELIVTSPLTRCLQTAMLSFPTLTTNNHNNSQQPPIPFVAQESIRETVNYACDRRRAISSLEEEFLDRVCFRHISHDHDEIWESYVRRLGDDYDSHRESAELHVVADRAREFFTWIRQRPEQEIVVCTHSAFLRAFLSWGHPGGVPMIMEQHLDSRQQDKNNDGKAIAEEEVPVVQYCGDESFEALMRSDYDNCELRSFVGAFPHH